MEDWRPDTQLSMDTPGKWGGTGGRSEIFFWVIPARVAGTWRWDLSMGGKPLAYEVTLDQKFQVVSGAGRIGGSAVKLQEIRLSGEDLTFTFTAEVNGAPVKHEFSGKVEGDSINGSVVVSGARVQGQQEWNARRSGPAGAAAPPAGVARPLRLAAGVSG
jgi:hypothetical protein